MSQKDRKEDAREKYERQLRESGETPDQIWKRIPKEPIDRTDIRIARTRSQKYLIESIMPEGEIHLLGGPSGVGKSTLLLRLLKDWTEGKPVMGFSSNPVPWVYIMCDSSETALQRKLDRIGLGDWRFPAYSVEGLGDSYGIMPHTIHISNLPNIFPKAKLFVIEAINWFYGAPDPEVDQSKGGKTKGTQDYVDVLRFWSGVRDSFGSSNLTIFGTTHTPKQKKGEGYEMTRDKIFGSVAIPATASTVMIMEARDGGSKVIDVCPREYPEFVAHFKTLENGALEFTERVVMGRPKAPDGTLVDKGASFLLDNQIVNCQTNSLLPRLIALGWGKTLGVSEATVDRWLVDLTKRGILRRGERGHYWITDNLKALRGGPPI